MFRRPVLNRPHLFQCLRVLRNGGVGLNSSFSSKTTGNEEKKFIPLSIDRSALLGNTGQTATFDPKNPPKNKSKSSELVPFLQSMIEVRGPLSVYEFFKQAMSHPQHGYYMRKDVFGEKGDFTTAPEISQMFGELIGIWCVATWQQMGSPSSFQLIELGPGRGTLLKDLLRAAKNFPEFYRSCEIHMVETSAVMRKLQQQNLDCEFLSGSKPKPNDSSTHEHSRMRIPGGPTVHWHHEFNLVPDAPSLIIAQELFDALPVHQFEYTEKGWCEKLVDVDFEDGNDFFRFALSPGPTLAVKAYLEKASLANPLDIPNFVEDGFTKISDDAFVKVPVFTKEASIGDKIEISPPSIALIQDIAKKISTNGGGALVVDYGHGHPSEDSLRGIKDHKFVSVLQEPGNVDLSIDVDFGTLKKFATEKENVKAYGPINQGLFLKNMGIEHRLAALFKNCTDEESEELYESYKRLVDDDQMGSIFKAMTIVNADIGTPVGFE